MSHIYVHKASDGVEYRYSDAFSGWVRDEDGHGIEDRAIQRELWQWLEEERTHGKTRRLDAVYRIFLDMDGELEERAAIEWLNHMFPATSHEKA